MKGSINLGVYYRDQLLGIQFSYPAERTPSWYTKHHCVLGKGFDFLKNNSLYSELRLVAETEQGRGLGYLLRSEQQRQARRYCCDTIQLISLENALNNNLRSGFVKKYEDRLFTPEEMVTVYVMEKTL